jgi:hypothetical protein
MGGMTKATQVIEGLATRGLFRARDVEAAGISRNWLSVARAQRLITSHGHGIWSHPDFQPTRYELAQIRCPRSVFAGPSALWLLGELEREPEEVWIAIGNKAHPPRTLDYGTVIVRTRRINDDVVELRPDGRVLTLRVHAPARARVDVERTDCDRLLQRSQEPRLFSLPRDAVLLTNVVDGMHPR